MTATKDALDLPRIQVAAVSHLSDLPSVRWLGPDGGVCMGRAITLGGVVTFLFDELSHYVYIAREGQYEPNVQKDANGNPVETK